MFQLCSALRSEPQSPSQKHTRIPPTLTDILVQYNLVRYRATKMFSLQIFNLESFQVGTNCIHDAWMGVCENEDMEILEIGSCTHDLSKWLHIYSLTHHIYACLNRSVFKCRLKPWKNENDTTETTIWANSPYLIILLYSALSGPYPTREA